MKHTYNFSLILLPLVVLLLLASTLFVQRTGIQYSVNSVYYSDLQFLPQETIDIENYFSGKQAESLVLYDSSVDEKYYLLLVENVQATLQSMRVKYDMYDVASNESFDLSGYKTAVVVLMDLQKGEAEIFSIMNWMESGGRVLFALRPDPSGLFDLIYPRLGATSVSPELVPATGVEFVSDLFPGAQGMILGTDFISGASYLVELRDDCTTHLVSGDENRTPILWECDRNKGRVVFLNSDQFSDKAARGVIGSSYSLLSDVFVYPVINSSVYYIDDFPAPLPEGQNDYITRYYPGVDSSVFFSETWWPQIKDIASKYGIRFTGGMIETYTQIVTPPLYKQLEPETHKLFGRSLLSIGGEIIFHGHNHVPLCTADNDVNSQSGYPSWPSTEAAQLAMVEVFTYANTVYPDYVVIGYMPPSNILCSDSRRWLPLVLPNLKFIASLYIPDEKDLSYDQEFMEASDGVIEFPRVISGFDIYDDEYMQWAAINELSLHYVNSHFMHPDDLLDPHRGAERGWENLREQYIRYIEWLNNAAPGLRNMVASEGAMAVQRFYRLALDYQVNDAGKLEISLGNFYDEAWLILSSDRVPTNVEGGSITKLSSDRYLIQALQPKIIISFEE